MTFLVSCASFGQESIKYVQVNRFNTTNYNLVKFDDFEDLMRENKISTVFFTNELFIIQSQNIAYTLDKNGYENLSDYKDGYNNFQNGQSYYYGKRMGLHNQEELDYYNSQPYFSMQDYNEAVKLKLVHRNDYFNGFYGIITKAELQNRIKYANISIYIISYLYQNRNRETLLLHGFTEEQLLIQLPKEGNNYGWNYTRTEDGTKLLDNYDIDFLLKMSGNYITKLGNFDYYLVNIPFDINKEALFYYLFKLAGFTSIEECNNNVYSRYRNQEKKYLIKNTDNILAQVGYKNIDDFLDADKKNIINSENYYYSMNYRIANEKVEQNIQLLRELEKIKLSYLNSISVNNDGDEYKKSQYSYLIYKILRLKKGEPITYESFINIVKNNEFSFHFEYGSILNQLFREVPQINNLITSGNGSFYLK
jgi:hypothetical protein